MTANAFTKIGSRAKTLKFCQCQGETDLIATVLLFHVLPHPLNDFGFC
jgi:hypothetical protein